MTNEGYLLQTGVTEGSPRCWLPKALWLHLLLQQAVREGNRRCRQPQALWLHHLPQQAVGEGNRRCRQPQALWLHHLPQQAVGEGNRRCRQLWWYPTRGGEGSRFWLRRSPTQGMIGGYLVRSKRCCPYASHIEAGSLHHRKGCWKMNGGYP